MPDHVTGSGDRDLRTSRQALVRYAATWLLAGVVAVAVVIVVLRQVEGEAPTSPALDPLAEVVESGCVLEDPRGREADLSRPPVAGPPAAPLRDGLYDRPQPMTRLIGALRRGVVVIHYDRRLPDAQVQMLRQAFAEARPRRALVPDASGMAFTVAATAWGRLLGCSRLDGDVVQGLQRFAERFAGKGPDVTGGG